MEGSQITVGYWKIRGLVRHIQLVAAYCGADINYVSYEQGDAPDFSREVWTSVKFNLGLDFPNLPYLQEGDFNLSETLAIIQYIVEKFKPELGGETLQEKATVNMLGMVAHGAKSCTRFCYMQDDLQKVVDEGIAGLQTLETYLGDKTYLLGEKICWVDIYLYELINLITACDKDGKCSEAIPNLLKLHTTVAEVPEIKAYLSSDKCLDLPFNNKSAKINP